MGDAQHMSTSTKILRAIEPIIYAKPTLTMTILVLLTIFFGFTASKIKPDAGYDKSIPLEHPYMQVLKQYQADFGGANNVLVALIQKPGKGEIYNEAFLASLKQATDEVFFLPGVDRSRVSSLFTPDVRFVEVVEGGFKGGNVIPAEYAPTPEMFQLVKGNTQKGGHVGRFTTKDQTGAMIFSELLEVDPVTGQKLDYAAVAEILEDKVRGRFISPKKYVYKLTADICQKPDVVAPPPPPAAGAEAADAAATAAPPPPVEAPETCVKAGTQVWERFSQPTGLAAAVDKGKPITYKFKPEGQDNELVFTIKKSQMTYETVDNPQYNPDVDVHILGFAKVVGDIIEELIPVVGFFLLTLVMTQLLLWAYLGSFKLALLPLVSSITAVVWEFGLLKLFGKGLDPFAILVPFLILSISVSHGVQYCNAWVGEIANNGRNSFDASVETWRRLAIYGTMAILTGVVGFALIGLIPIDIIREMALNACLGMFAIVITNKIMMPIMLTWIDVGDPKTFKEKQEQRDSIFDPLWKLLSYMVLPKPAITAILVAGLLLGWSLWKGKEKLAAMDKACPVHFALASAQVGVMAATNEEVHRLEKPILYIVYAGIIVCVFLSFFEWQSIVAIMLPLALVSWMAYAVMAVLGIGMKTATLPVVALAAGVGVDYGIYIYATFADALAAGYQRQAGYFKTLKLTGKAVAFTGLTLSIGVATWLWSGLQFQRDMGKLLVFMFTANMFGALLLLPAIASFILTPKKLAPGEEPVFKPRH